SSPDTAAAGAAVQAAVQAQSSANAKQRRRSMVLSVADECLAMQREDDSNGVRRDPAVARIRSIEYEAPDLLEQCGDESGQEAQITQAQVAILVARQIGAEAVDIVRDGCVDRAVGPHRARDLGEKALARQLGEVAHEEQV